LSHVNEKQNQLLDELLEMVESKKTENKELDFDELKAKADQTHLNVRHYDKLDTLLVSDDESWERFMEKTTEFAFSHGINLEKDPFDSLLSRSEKIELTKKIRKDYQMSTPDCDKYDYLIASFSGVVTGMIDSFFFGMPGESKLGNWTDKKIDHVVIKFANTVWHA